MIVNWKRRARALALIVQEEPRHGWDYYAGEFGWSHDVFHTVLAYARDEGYPIHCHRSGGWTDTYTLAETDDEIWAYTDQWLATKTVGLKRLYLSAPDGPAAAFLEGFLVVVRRSQFDRAKRKVRELFPNGQHQNV